MSLLEWLFERKNPGPVGGVDAGIPDEGGVDPSVRKARAVVAATAIGGIVYLIQHNADSPKDLGVAIGALVAYIAIGSYFHPKPDYSNVGLLGGLIDHPLRWSDDVNRILAFLLVLLYPGRLLGIGLRDIVWWVRSFTVLSGFRQY
jgi:hypothetical protein